MREIKFRAWDRLLKKMIYGVTHVGEYKCNQDCKKGKEIFTLMQFTGVKDNYKVEIYESDILKDKNGILWTVHFLMGKFSIYCSSKELFKALDVKDKEKTEEEEIADHLDAWWVGTEVVGDIYSDVNVATGEGGKDEN